MGLDLVIAKKAILENKYEMRVPRNLRDYFIFTDNPDRIVQKTVFSMRLGSYSYFHHFYRKPLVNFILGNRSMRCRCDIPFNPPYSHFLNFSDVNGVYMPANIENVVWVHDKYSIGNLNYLYTSLNKLYDIVHSQHEYAEIQQPITCLLYEVLNALENNYVVSFY